MLSAELVGRTGLAGAARTQAKALPVAHLGSAAALAGKCVIVRKSQLLVQSAPRSTTRCDWVVIRQSNSRHMVGGVPRA